MIFFLQSLRQEALGVTIDFLPKFISGIFILFMFYTASVFVKMLSDRFFKTEDVNKLHIAEFTKKALRASLIVVGVLTMLGTWGVDISAIVVGLGLTGFAFGFAMKDVLSSVLSGILVLVYRPFGIGDTIQACGIEGEVTSIDMRYTTVKSFDGQKHLIPNSKLLSEKVSVISSALNSTPLNKNNAVSETSVVGKKLRKSQA